MLAGQLADQRGHVTGGLLAAALGGADGRGRRRRSARPAGRPARPSPAGPPSRPPRPARCTTRPGSAPRPAGSGFGSGFGSGLASAFGAGFGSGFGSAGAAPAAPMIARSAPTVGGLVLGDLDLQHGAGDRRRDLGVDLVGGDLQQRLVDLDGLADLLEPAGDGALGDALAQGRHLHRRCPRPTAPGRPAPAGCLDGSAAPAAGALGGGRRLGGRLGLLGSAASLLRGGLAAGRLALAGDDGQLAADLGGLVLADHDPAQHARRGGRDLGVDLVGRDLEQRLVDLDGVALLLEPAGDGALGDALAEPGHGDRYRHVLETPSFPWWDPRPLPPDAADSRDQACACSGLPARARCASPRASFWVGWACTSCATSAGYASQL